MSSRHLVNNVPQSPSSSSFFKKVLDWNLRWRIVKVLRNDPVWKLIRNWPRQGRIEVCEVGCGSEGGVLAGAPPDVLNRVNYIGFNPELDTEKVAPYVRENITFANGYADEKSVASGSKDLVVCMEVLEHIPPQDRAGIIKNMLGFLKDDGVLVVSYPVQGHMRTNVNTVRALIADRKKKFGPDDFVWDVQHFQEDNPEKEYLVPENSYMKTVLEGLGQYRLEVIPNINIRWWKFLYKMQYGVYPVLPYVSRIIFQPLFPLVKLFVHRGETFREIYFVRKAI